MGRCRLCGSQSRVISDIIGYCVNCLREGEFFEEIKNLRNYWRGRFSLPPSPPRDGSVSCSLCVNLYRGDSDTQGFCGKPIVSAFDRVPLVYYYDPLPTNCVAAWCCGGRKKSGYKNLAVFYQRCNFDCLFCQNWDFRDSSTHRICSVDALVTAVDERVACVCFFGGDPTPSFPHSLSVAKKILDRGMKVMICWETNGSVNPSLMKEALEIALISGGCVKFDLKFFSDNLNRAICGASNSWTLKNFEMAAEFFGRRPDPPVVVASTLLVPGYVDERELEAIASFISSCNPHIPWSLLAFYPTFILKDLPTTSWSHARKAEEIAMKYGIKRVNLGNIHLLSDYY